MSAPADEGIVRRHCIKGSAIRVERDRWMRIRRQVSRLLVHIDAQDRRVKTFVDETGVVELVVATATIAHADVEKTIGAKVQIATVVIARWILLG